MKHRTLISLVCAIACLGVAAGCSQSQGVPAGDRLPGAAAALSSWTNQRAYPGADIPEHGLSPALSFVQQSMRPPLPSKALHLGAWTSIGPHNIGGRTLAVAVSPADPELLYAGSASGGLWRSATGGVGAAAWQRVPLGHPAVAVSAIAISTTEPETIYIGTGEVYNYQNAEIFGKPYRSMRGSYGIGVLKSTDGGSTWTSSLDWSAAQQRAVQAVKIDPSATNTVWAATTQGVYRTTDSGNTWQLMLEVLMATDVVIDPLNSDLVIAGCGNFSSPGKGIYRSEDRGETWTQVMGAQDADFMGKIQLAISESSPNIVFASVGSGFYTNDPDEFTRLLRSTDSGRTWSTASTVNYATYQGWFSHDVAISPVDADEIITVGYYIWRSHTGGTNLVRKSSFNPYGGVVQPGEAEGPPDYVHPDIHDVIFHPYYPSLVYFGTDGGVYRSTDGGDTFEACNGGYQTAQFYPGFSSSPVNSDFAIGGLQDNSTTIYHGSTAWSMWNIGGDGSYTAIDSSRPWIIYGSSQYLRMYRSTNSGASWDYTGPNLGYSRPTCFIAPFALAVDDPDVIYAGRDLVLKSTNGGVDWDYTNNGSSLDHNPIQALVVSSASSDVVYAATTPYVRRSGVFRTWDGGSTWTEITGDLPDRFPTDLALDPNNDSVVYISFSGFGSSHLFRSTNGGISWQDLGSGLPDAPTPAVVVDPLASEHLYVGTDIGVFSSTDGGSTWLDFNTGMVDVVAVMDLEITPSRKLRAVTHGNGVWERTLLSASLSEAEVD